MNTRPDFDRHAAAWLADGPTELADRVLDAALREVHLTKQRRRWSTPWRTPSMSLPLRAAVAIAIVAVLGVGALTFFKQGSAPGVGGQPTPSPTIVPTTAPSTTAAAQQSPPIDTSTWTIYSSVRNVLSIKHPANWTEEPSDHDWTLARDAAWPNSAAEKFVSPDGQVAVAAWSVAVQPGADLEAWIATYCPLNTTPCTGIHDRAVPVTAVPDGQQGLLISFESDAQAFFLKGNRIWVVATWRGQFDPAVQSYGGARRLLEAFAGTLCVTCAAPSPTTPLPS
jgi:hypothetical protein